MKVKATEGDPLDLIGHLDQAIDQLQIARKVAIRDALVVYGEKAMVEALGMSRSNMYRLIKEIDDEAQG